MKFDDITNAVSAAWDFAWPPVLIIALTYLCGRAINPVGTANAVKSLFSYLKGLAVKVDGLRGLLDSYSLTKLIPIVSAIVVICFLYIINGPILATIHHLPPSWSFEPDRVVWRSLPDRDKLLVDLKYPAAGGFNYAYNLAISEYAPGNVMEKSQFYFKLQDIAKYMACAATVIFIFSRGNRKAWGFVKMLLFAAAFWLGVVIPLLSHVQQEFQDRWIPVRIALQHDAERLLAIDKNEKAQAASHLAMPETNSRHLEYSTKGPWWHLSLLRPEFSQWLIDTLWWRNSF